jgi:YVTN family beta-propeller protein
MVKRSLALIGLSLVVLALAARPTPPATPANNRPAYENPLDVIVSANGQTALVALSGTQRLALVDLAKGRVKKEIAPVDLLKRGVKKEYPFRNWDPAETPLHGLNSKEVAIHHMDVIPHYGNYDYISFRAGCGTSEDDLKNKKKGQITALLIYRYANTEIPTTQITQGWIFNAAVTFFEGLDYMFPHGDHSDPVALNEPQQGLADPSDAVLSPDGKRAFVAFAGSDKALVIDVYKLKKYLSKKRRRKNKRLDKPEFDLTASRHFVIAKLPTQANPRRLGLSGDGKTLVVSNYLADSLTVIDAVNLKVLRHISLGGPKPDAARRGEILFNSAKMTFHRQFTCASCHPNGGSDGLTWDLTRDGIGNFKKTKSLLGVKDTAPYGWHGSSPTLADRVEGTLRTLHQHEPKGNEVADLVAYLKSLPPPKPPTPKEADKPAIARGKKIFQGKGLCANCHRRTALDDGKTHDIGTRGPGDTQSHFDTPALLGVSRNPPYLHDGRTKSLRAIFTDYNPKNRHGAAHKLTGKECDDLITYLESL